MTKDRMAMTRSGFCAHPSEGSHEFCREFVKRDCSCSCHEGVLGSKTEAVNG